MKKIIITLLVFLSFTQTYAYENFRVWDTSCSNINNLTRYKYIPLEYETKIENKLKLVIAKFANKTDEEKIEKYKFYISQLNKMLENKAQIEQWEIFEKHRDFILKIWDFFVCEKEKLWDTSLTPALVTSQNTEEAKIVAEINKVKQAVANSKQKLDIDNLEAIWAYWKAYYVATNWNDDNEGTLASPFKTIYKVRDVIAKLKEDSGLPNNGVVVFIRWWNYYFEEDGFRLTTEHSWEEWKKIIYRKYQNEKVRFIWWKKLDNNIFTKVNSSDNLWSKLDTTARNNIYVADLWAIWITDDNIWNMTWKWPMDYYISPMELFQNDEPMILARWPDKDAINYTEPDINDNYIYVTWEMTPDVTGKYIKQSGQLLYQEKYIREDWEYYIKRSANWWKTYSEAKWDIIGTASERTHFTSRTYWNRLPRAFEPHSQETWKAFLWWNTTTIDHWVTFTKDQVYNTHSGDQTKPNIFIYEWNRADRWNLTNDKNKIYVNGAFFKSRSTSIIEISNIDKSNKKISLIKRPQYGLETGMEKLYFMLNIPNELTTPWEYYIDRETKKLYFYPKYNISNSEIIVSISQAQRKPHNDMKSLESFIKLEKASYIEFHWITFEIAKNNLFLINDSSHIRIYKCILKNGWKDWFKIEWDLSDWNHHNWIEYSEIYNMAETWLSIRWGDRPSLQPWYVYARNNIIHDNWRINWTTWASIGIWWVWTEFTHNEVYNARYLWMRYGWNELIIEYNNFHDIMQFWWDGWVIYSWFDWTYRWNKIRYNYIHDIKNNLRHWEWIVWTYWDDCKSWDYYEWNIVENLEGTAFFLNWGRDSVFKNNIAYNVSEVFWNNNNCTHPNYISEEPGHFNNLLDTMTDAWINNQTEPWKSKYPVFSKMPQTWAELKSGEQLWLMPVNNVFKNNAAVKYNRWLGASAGAVSKSTYTPRQNLKYFKAVDYKPVSIDDYEFEKTDYSKIWIQQQ